MQYPSPLTKILLDLDRSEQKRRLGELRARGQIRHRRDIVVPTGAPTLRFELKHLTREMRVVFPDVPDVVMINGPDGPMPIMTAVTVSMSDLKLVFEADGSTPVGYVQYWRSNVHPMTGHLSARWPLGSQHSQSPKNLAKEAVSRLSAMSPLWHGAQMTSFTYMRTDGQIMEIPGWSSRTGIFEGVDIAHDFNLRQFGIFYPFSVIWHRLRRLPIDHPDRTRSFTYIDAPTDHFIDQMEDPWLLGDRENIWAIYRQTLAPAAAHLIRSWTREEDVQKQLLQQGIDHRNQPMTIGLIAPSHMELADRAGLITIGAAIDDPAPGLIIEDDEED